MPNLMQGHCSKVLKMSKRSTSVGKFVEKTAAAHLVARGVHATVMRYALSANAAAHRPLSEGIHAHSDAECRKIAKDITLAALSFPR